MNKHLLYTSIVFTILTIIWLIISYYGYDRYINFLYPTENKLEKYINNYKNIQTSSSDKRVIVVLYISADDLKNIDQVYSSLLSLLDQTVRVDDIRLYISNPNNIELNIPSKLKDIVSIYNLPSNADKLTYPLYKVDDNNSIIIYLEPTIIYGKDFLQTIMEQYNNDCILTIKNKILLLSPKQYNLDDNNKIIIEKTCKYTPIIYNENYKI